MVALRTKFDGQKILVPEELRGQGPRDVVVLIEEPSSSGNMEHPSMFEFFGKAPLLRETSDIDAQIEQERTAWGDR